MMTGHNSVEEHVDRLAEQIKEEKPQLVEVSRYGDYDGRVPENRYEMISECIEPTFDFSRPVDDSAYENVGENDVLIRRGVYDVKYVTEDGDYEWTEVHSVDVFDSRLTRSAIFVDKELAATDA